MEIETVQRSYDLHYQQVNKQYTVKPDLTLSPFFSFYFKNNQSTELN